jgi:hypothetical protein
LQVCVNICLQIERRIKTCSHVRKNKIKASIFAVREDQQKKFSQQLETKSLISQIEKYIKSIMKKARNLPIFSHKK